MPQDFEFYIVPENKWCFNCIMQQYCDLKSIVGVCDRWAKVQLGREEQESTMKFYLIFMIKS